MTWIWISAIIVLLGAELNAEMEHQTAQDSTEGAEKPLGMRGATMAALARLGEFEADCRDHGRRRPACDGVATARDVPGDNAGHWCHADQRPRGLQVGANRGSTQVARPMWLDPCGSTRAAMAMMKRQTLVIDDIYVPVKRRQTLDPKKVETIAESILSEGQKVPILVRADGNRFVLIEGLHRLEACRALGEQTVFAYLVHARLH
jgi:sulfiredoxin